MIIICNKNRIAHSSGLFYSNQVVKTFCQFSWTFPHPPLRARDQTTIHGVETNLFSPSKEGQGIVIGRIGDGLCVLGCKGHCVHWLPSGRPNYWGMLCQLADDAAAKGNQVKTAWKTDVGSPDWPGKCSKSVVSMTVVCDCSFELVEQPPYSTEGRHLYSVPKHEKNTWLGSTIGPMMRSNLQLKTLWRSGWELLYTKISLVEVVRGLQGRLCKKKKKHSVKFHVGYTTK